MNIKDIVKNNMAHLSYASEGILYYVVEVDNKFYQFPVDMNNKEDIGTATFMAHEKAIILMRYIRKALSKNEFLPTNRIYF